MKYVSYADRKIPSVKLLREHALHSRSMTTYAYLLRRLLLLMFLDPHPAQSVSEPTKKGGKKEKERRNST